MNTQVHLQIAEELLREVIVKDQTVQELYGYTSWILDIGKARYELAKKGIRYEEANEALTYLLGRIDSLNS
jgi:hypothetical protein